MHWPRGNFSRRNTNVPTGQSSQSGSLGAHKIEIQNVYLCGPFNLVRAELSGKVVSLPSFNK